METVVEEILFKEGNNKEKKISECVDMLFKYYVLFVC